MRGVSHVILGSAALLALGLVRPALSVPFALAAGVNVLGSLLPDIDSDESTIRRSTGTARSQGVIGRLASALLPGHRGWVHSIWLAVAIGAVCIWIGSPLALAFGVGWCVHILADKGMGVIGLKNGGIAETLIVIGVCIAAWGKVA